MEKRGTTKQESIPANTPTINQTEKMLVENFVSLQKVMVDLSEKFSNLSIQLSQLLRLFEVSAKTLAEKGFEDNHEIVRKIDMLLDQNKIIAKGITLLHEEEIEPEYSQTPKPMPQEIPMIKRPQPPMQMRPPMMPKSKQPPMQKISQEIDKEGLSNMQGYQKSISSG